MSWEVELFPRCTHHVFIAYSSEDAERLARPLRNELMEQRGISAWLAEFDLPTASTTLFADLRRALLRSRIIVYLVTKNSLSNGRGWQAVERAYGELIEQSLSCETPLQFVELLLLFECSFEPNLGRSCWYELIKNGRFEEFPRHEECDEATRVRWAADRITLFLGTQIQDGNQSLLRIDAEPHLRQFVDARPGLRDRVACRFPEF